jgi:uncharacterized protein YwqG
MDEREIRERLTRRAIVLDVGGFQASQDPTESWFGHVSVCATGESWPETGGRPMHALCQINLTGIPFRPKRLEDVEMLAVFIGPDTLPMDEPNGQNWCIRAYPRIAGLVPLAHRDTGSKIKSFPMRARVVEHDFPCWEDVPLELSEEIAADNYFDLFENTSGLKLGGWPTLVQAEIYWAPWNRHPAAPEYVFQIDSENKAHWSWGDGGVGYFGRGTAEGKEDEWTCAWQCY